MLEENDRLDEEKRFLRRYNRLRLRSGLETITIDKLQQLKKWKFENKLRRPTRETPEYLKSRKRWMRIMQRWNRLRKRKGLPPLDCKQVEGSLIGKGFLRYAQATSDDQELIDHFR
jgi:hypothetical protein